MATLLVSKTSVLGVLRRRSPACWEGLGKQPQMVGMVGWRKDKRRSSEIQLREKQKESTHCPVVFFFCLFFIYTMEPTMEMSWESMHEPRPWEWCRRVWGGSYLLPGPPHTLSSGTLLQADHCFLSCLSSSSRWRSAAHLPSRWWPGTGGWVAESSARAPQWNCLSPRTSCTCSGWQKPHCSRSGTS